MTRSLILGAGSIGTVYAFILKRAGADVTCICRSNYKSAKEHGFTIDSSIWGYHHFETSVVPSSEEAVRTVDANGPFDYVIICAKSLPARDGQPTMATLLQPLVATRTAIVIIQNGLGVEHELHTAYPNNVIISGVAYLPTTQIRPSSVSHSEMERLHLGIYPASSPSSELQQPQLKEFASILGAGGATVLISPDVQVERWKKIIANGAWNPICALSRCRDVEFLTTSPYAQELVRDIMHEICAVAAAVGYAEHINEATVAYQMSRTAARQYPGVQPSMMADMLAGRSMEVDAVLVEILRLGDQHCVPCQRLKTMYALLSGLDHALRKQ